MHLRILYLRLAIYILLLIVFSGLLFLSVQALNWYAVLCIIGIIWVIYRIIRLFNRNPQKLSYFLNAIENQDSTLFFSEKIRHKPTKELHGSLNRMNQLIQEVKLKNREQEQYYSLLLEQVATGIVVMNDSGNILLANSAARSLLNYSFLNHIEQLKRVDIKLYNAFLSLQQDNQNQFVKVRNENGIRQLSLQVTSFKRHDNALRIVSVHDISNELDLKNLPATGRYIIVSNHPLGGLDGMALMQEIGKVRTDFLFPVNDLLMNLPNLKQLFIPINKHGSNTENIQLFNDTFASDILLLYFPAGLVSRKQGKEIIDLEWKKTFLSKAIQYQRDIIPVHISGRNTNFFYNLANWRKKLGIKANIEMLYLVDEMFKQKDKTITITFGTPIPIKVFDKRYSNNQWAKLLKEHVYKLGSSDESVFKYITN
jgi:putative hemolysin